MGDTSKITKSPPKASLKPIRPIASKWAPRWKYRLSAVLVHATTHCRFDREQLGPAPPKAAPDPTQNNSSCLTFLFTDFRRS